MNLYTTEQTKKIDNLAIKEKGSSGFSLMQKAAEFSLDVLIREFNYVDEVIVFCSKGKNSGDGFLLAAYAKEFGLKSTVVMCNPEKDLQGVQRKAFEDAKDSNVKIISFRAFKNLKLSKNTVIVDSLIGIGLKGELRKNIETAISEINKLSIKYPILSLDIPSGICSNSGASKGLSVEADVTVTFVAKKRGLYTSIGRRNSGDIFYSNLDISKGIFNKVKSNCFELSFEKYLPELFSRQDNSHKGNFGHVCVVGGDHGYGGAGILAAKAAMNIGSGLTSLITRPEHVTASLTSCPEVMVTGVNSGQDSEELLKKCNVIAIGPGLGQSAWSEQLLQRVHWEAEERNVPVIMDADALNLLTKLKLSSQLPKNLLITPHPGEASRLLKTNVANVEIDRFKSTLKLQKKYNATVVLKGAGSIIGYIKKRNMNYGVCTAGNPGMAKGGMGDILTGIIAGLIGQGFSLSEAAEIGVDLHSKAADLASMEVGEIGLTPTDVIDAMRELVRYD